MANEAVLKLRRGHPVDMVVTDTNAIEKGALLILTDARTCSGTVVTTAGAQYAGVAAREKIASDGRTRIAVFPPGVGNVYDMKANNDAIQVGDKVVMSGINLIRAATSAEVLSGVAVIGTALETASGNEVIEVLS